MSRRGNCHDNAVAESFFNLLKRERIRRRTYRTREEARQDVFDYIEMFYNPKRKHVRNGMLSPVELERQQEMYPRASKKLGATHDLRGTAATMLAEAGCTTPQIAAITGHSLKTVTGILDKYLARTRALAGETVTLFENAKSTEFANQLQTNTPDDGDVKAK
jgi:putative transposase